MWKKLIKNDEKIVKIELEYGKKIVDNFVKLIINCLSWTKCEENLSKIVKKY